MSVLLPCRNAEATLPEAIAGLRAQTMGDYEVIAVDDGSTDATRARLEEWSREDRRVSVVATKPDSRGIVAALRLGAEVSTSPLLARMDADDIALPGRFAAQLAAMSDDRTLAGCGTHVEIFPDPGPGYRRYAAWINALETPAALARAALVECPVAHPTLLVKRSVFDAVGGYRDMGWPEDYDLVLRVLAAGARLANAPGPAYLRWRVSPGRLSLTDPVYDAASFRRCRVHFLVECFLPARRPVVIWGAGKVGKPLARELIARGRPPAAFVDLDPRKIGQSIHGAPVRSPADFVERVAGARRSGPAMTPYVLAAVGSPGVREEIRSALCAAGLTEIDDFRFCA